MKQYSLLPDQTISTYTRGEQLLSFSDAEELLNDAELADMKDESFELELALSDRKFKKEIRHLENEIGRWSVLVDSLPGIGFAAEFDNQTLAVLRGRLVRFLMRSREVSVCVCFMLVNDLNCFFFSDNIWSQHKGSIGRR